MHWSPSFRITTLSFRLFSPPVARPLVTPFANNRFVMLFYSILFLKLSRMLLRLVLNLITTSSSRQRSAMFLSLRARFIEVAPESTAMSQQPQRAGSPPEFLVKVREILSTEDDSIISWENGARGREEGRQRVVRARRAFAEPSRRRRRAAPSCPQATSTSTTPAASRTRFSAGARALPRAN